MSSIYILKIAENRQEIFDEYARDRGYFSEAVKDFPDHGSIVILIVSSSGQLTHIALGEQSRVRAGSGLKKLNLLEIEELEPAFSINDLLPHIEPKFHPHIKRYFTSGGEPPAASVQALIAALEHLDSKTGEVIRRYLAPRYERLERLSSRTKENLATQKDALSTALSIAGIERTELKEWSLPEREQPRSFLDGLRSAYLREDQMILRDLHKIPGFEKVDEPVSGAARFEGPTSNLTVVLANRLPLEELTGTDLIYYNETFHSFVMVQYKAMEREDGEPIFRLPNKQLAEEIARMEKVLGTLVSHPASTEPDNFRFSENPFFLKLCPRIDLLPGSSDMTAGMYLPLEYWNVLELDSDIAGPLGGRQITYKNVRRYLNNTEFIDLVRKAWVGTNAAQSGMLEPLIRSIVESGRAALIAIRSGGIEMIEPDQGM